MPSKNLNFKKILKSLHISFKPGFDADKDWMALSIGFFILFVSISILNLSIFFKVRSHVLESLNTEQSKELIDKNKFTQTVLFYKQRSQEFLNSSNPSVDGKPEAGILGE